jgi:hypothetical protein
MELLIGAAKGRNVLDGFRSARGDTGCSYGNDVTIASYLRD